MAVEPLHKTTDRSEAPYWSVLQALIWACTRKKTWVRMAADLSRDPSQLIYQATLNGTVLPFEVAERDLITRLSKGELRALGMRNGAGNPEEIEQSQWPYLTFCLEPPEHLASAGGLCALPGDYELRSQGALRYWTHIFIPSEDILKRWRPQLAEPDACYSLITETTGEGSAKPENRLVIQTSKSCRQWLGRLMRIGKKPKLAKGFYRKRAQKKFNITGRAFDREWARAVVDTGAGDWGWGKAGRKPRRKLSH